MRKTAQALAFALGFMPALAVAQVPGFPQTIPANTVIGRLGILPGPSQAIPFAIFTNALLANGIITINGTPCKLASSCSPLALTPTGVTAGSYGSSSAIPFFTVNSTGQLTLAGTNAVVAQAGTLAGTALANNVVTSALTALGTVTTGVWNATPILGTFIATNTVANANLTQVPAATFKGNPTNATAVVQDFTIQGLTARGAPDANNDKIPIFDNAAGAIKYVTPGQIAVAATAGVSSLNGQTGALFALVPANNLSDLTNTDVAIRNIGANRFRVPLAPGQTIDVFGDSIPAGQGATVAATFGFVPMFAQYTQATLNNFSIGSSGSNSATTQLFQHLALNNTTVNVWMASHNDISRNGAAPATISKLKGELRTFIASHFLSTVRYGDDASLTKVGTWTTNSGLTANAKAFFAGANIVFSATVGDKITGSFTGDNLVVGTFNSDGVVKGVGTFTVAVDGATSGPGFAVINGQGKSDGVADPVYDNQLTHDVTILTGIGVGSHTFVITVTSASGFNSAYVDYVGTMKPHSAGAPLIVSETWRPNATGFANNTPPGVWTPAAIDAADLAVTQVVAEFANYPIARPKVTFYQDLANDLIADGVHPNNLGHRHIAQAFEEIVDVRRPAAGGAAAWVNFTGSAVNGPQTINDSFNVSSVTRSALGTYVVTYIVPFASTFYACHTGLASVPQNGFGETNGKNVGSTGISFVTVSGGALTNFDPTGADVICFGRQ